MQEPFSPELALVDPELARSLAWAPEPRPAWEAAVRVSPPRLVPAPRSPRGHISRISFLVLLLSLAANGFLLARNVAPTAAPAGFATVLATEASSSVASTTAQTAAAVSGAGAAERAVLSMVVENPAARLPPALVDEKTGLAENNLQAVCRTGTDESYLCTVRPAVHRPGEGLAVRYRPGQAGAKRFTWSAYRGG